MTAVYEVETRHTRKVLKAFIRFSNRIKSPFMTARLLCLSLCFYTLSYIAGERRGFMLGFLCLGVFVTAFALVRGELAFLKLSREDKEYRENAALFFRFGEEGITLKIQGEEPSPIGYKEISFIYEDRESFYISVGNERVYLLPKKDFTKGRAQEFGGFLKEKTGKEIKLL